MRLPMETIITQYQQNLFAVRLNICKSPQDGEDVVQDTLLAYLSTHKDFETGDQTDVTIDFNADGSYAMEYLDKEGNLAERQGGGVAFEPDGTERPLTPEELMEELMHPDVIYEDDGSVWVYYIDQAVEITDKFNDGICYVQIPDGDGILYMTIKYQKGDAISPYKFVAPWEFN